MTWKDLAFGFLIALLLLALGGALVHASGVMPVRTTPTPTVWPVRFVRPLMPTPTPTAGWWTTPPAWLTPTPTPTPGG